MRYAYSQLITLSVSLDDLGTLFIQKLVAAVRAEELNSFMPELVPVTVELAFALGAGHPKDLRHDSLPWIRFLRIYCSTKRAQQSLSRQDAKLAK